MYKFTQTSVTCVGFCTENIVELLQYTTHLFLLSPNATNSNSNKAAPVSLGWAFSRTPGRTRCSSSAYRPPEKTTTRSGKRWACTPF